MLTDLILPRPLPDTILRMLLFAGFSLHMLFVLLTIGTAVLAIYYFIDFRWGGKPAELQLDKRILKSFLAHKSLAVVLGVAPLLLLQVSYTVPFFTAVNLFAPYWLFLIVLLIVSFISFDLLGHGMKVHPHLHLLVAILGGLCLLCIPMIFSAVLTATENPAYWLSILRNGYHFTGTLTAHWLIRYLHIIGAGILFGTVYHYLFSAEHETERRSLRRLALATLLAQSVLGVILYTTLDKPGLAVVTALSVGVAAAALLIWLLALLATNKRPTGVPSIVIGFVVVLVSMLLVRQLIQDAKILPLQATLKANAAVYAVQLRPHERSALDGYNNNLQRSYDSGQSIFRQSCSFCHGENADGRGPDASLLQVAPEDLTAIRATRPYLQQIVDGGVPGSAMPYFAFLDRDKRERLLDFLGKTYGIFGQETAAASTAIQQRQAQEARRVYEQTCSVCHGIDGSGSPLSKGFQPSAPDFRYYSLSEIKAIRVISSGYKGTVMPAFETLPDDIRAALVRVLWDKRLR
jgi:mono/diheme cytochrome c family protein